MNLAAFLAAVLEAMGFPVGVFRAVLFFYPGKMYAFKNLYYFLSLVASLVSILNHTIAGNIVVFVGNHRYDVSYNSMCVTL